MCVKLVCTKDFVSTKSAFAAAEGTSCGAGKWCIDGVCKSDSSAPQGTCLIDDDSAFCNDNVNKYGRDYVCNNYRSTTVLHNVWWHKN